MKQTSTSVSDAVTADAGAAPLSRTAMLVEEAGLAKLAAARVAVFGVGGVGGFVCEALARCGVGSLDLFDDDVVAPSNLNRQITALHSTLWQPKAEVMAARIADIAPACRVTVHRVFYLPENAAAFDLAQYDYIVDAVDTVAAKVELIQRARAANVKLVSAMGTGNKLHPELLQLADISKTSVCPLARAVRRELRRRGIEKGVRVVFSTEQPLPAKPCGAETPPPDAACLPARPGAPKRQAPGSISFVPSAAGLILAGEVARGLLGL